MSLVVLSGISSDSASCVQYDPSRIQGCGGYQKEDMWADIRIVTLYLETLDDSD